MIYYENYYVSTILFLHLHIIQSLIHIIKYKLYYMKLLFIDEIKRIPNRSSILIMTDRLPNRADRSAIGSN